MITQSDPTGESFDQNFDQFGVPKGDDYRGRFFSENMSLFVLILCIYVHVFGRKNEKSGKSGRIFGLG